VTIDDALVLPDEAPAATQAWSTGTLQTRLLEVAAAGALAAVLLVLFWLKPRPDFWAAIGHPFFWIKGLYTAILAAIALGGATAAARPGAPLWPALVSGGAMVVLMTLAVAFEAPGLDAALIAHIFNPRGAFNCVFYVSVLSASMLLVAGVGLRGVELERPGLTGLFVGLFSGAVAATIYSVHCQDSTFLFVALWYSLGVALCGAVGAAALKLISRRPRPDPADGSITDV